MFRCLIGQLKVHNERPILRGENFFLFSGIVRVSRRGHIVNLQNFTISFFKLLI